MSIAQHEKLSDLRRRLHNARCRAAYASERPSFAKNVWRRRRGAKDQRGADELYELAMCDIRSLSRAIESITGKLPKQTDQKSAYKLHFVRNIMPAINRK